MKVLHVLETLSPRYGGPVRVVTELAGAEQQAGHEVAIVTTQAEHPTGVFCEPGWGVLGDGGVRVLYGALHYAPLRVSLDLARYLRDGIGHFDLVYVHGLYRFPSTYAAYQARKHHVPYIIRPQGSLDPYLYDKSSRSVWLKRVYERWFDLPNLHNAGAIHYMTGEERARASFLKLRAPSFVLPNGLAWEPYRTLPQRGRLRARWAIGEAPTVLFLGRLHFKKGLDLLIPAFDALRKQVRDAQLVIAGPENDDYGQKVRRWVQDRNLNDAVHFVGSLHGAEVTQAYVDADVFALPSYTENFGMAVVEAMACGLPVVISDQVNIHPEVTQAGAGLVTRCNIDELAKAMEALLSAPGQRRAMAAAGRRLVQENYAWPAIVDALTQEYEGVIERHRRGINIDRARQADGPTG